MAQRVGRSNVRVAIRTRPTAAWDQDEIFVDPANAHVQVHHVKAHKDAVSNAQEDWGFKFNHVLHNSTQCVGGPLRAQGAVAAPPSWARWRRQRRRGQRKAEGRRAARARQRLLSLQLRPAVPCCARMRACMCTHASRTSCSSRTSRTSVRTSVHTLVRARTLGSTAP
jgi:hypothetical protein